MPVNEQSEVESHALPAPHAQKLLPAPAKPPSAFGWRKIVFALILIAAGIFAYYRIKGNKKEAAATEAKTVQAANRPIPVTVSSVLSRTMPIYITALGTVTAYNTVTVKSRVDGQLLTVPVREGQQVTQGQTLATIDPRPYLAVQAQAEGQLVKDQAVAANAQAEAGRYSALYQAGVISKESEQAQVSNSGQSEGALAADRAAIQAAKVNVAYTRITSPINGVVGLRQVDAGNIVHAADTTGLLVVTQLQPIAVIFTLPEDQLQQVLKGIRAGHKLVVEAFDRSETTHLASGTLLTVDNQIDTTTGTVKAKAVFENRDGALFPNQFVNVRLILEQRPNSLVVPAAAIQNGANGSFVYVVKKCPDAGCPKTDGGGGSKGGGKGKATASADAATPPAAGDEKSAAPQEKSGPKYFVAVQNVVLDLTEGSQVIVKSGVASGDSVVIDGQEKLKKNARVAPQQGKSNAGGPSTQTIGSSDAPGSPQPAGPDQPNPDQSSPSANTPKRTGKPSEAAGATGSRQ